MTLAAFIDQHDKLFVLTGAGISTASGIPDYRDTRGEWKQSQPVDIREFRRSEQARQRYWARSTVGWKRFDAARPSRAHHALAILESHAKLSGIVTQNVDGLHQRAGSGTVIDLHGRNDRVVCDACDYRIERAGFQRNVLSMNPDLHTHDAPLMADGDAALEHYPFTRFAVPACPQCNGILRPDVVFFGENVPRARVAEATGMLESASAMLVVGSSLMVYSGFRFVRHARSLGLPLAIINRGITRDDSLFDLRLIGDCNTVLADALLTLRYSCTSTP